MAALQVKARKRGEKSYGGPSRKARTIHAGYEAKAIGV
jgi:hypothetical protein